MNIVNEKTVRIYKYEDKYSVGISKKNADGEYENAYFPIQFNKGVELEDKTLIKIKNAWLSFYNWEYEDKKGTKFFIKCNDFEEIKQEKKEPEQKKETNPFEEFGREHQVELNYTDEDGADLPF